MNLAICIHGLVGGKTGKDGQGGNLPVDSLYDHVIERIVKPNSKAFAKINFFIHSWSVEEEEQILQLYKPVDHVIEPRLPFPGAKKEARRFSKLTSLQKSIQLCDKHTSPEDIILSIRFDAYYKKDLKVSTPKNATLTSVCFPGDPPSWGHSAHRNRLCDFFFFGKKAHIIKFFSEGPSSPCARIFDRMRAKDKKLCYAHHLDNHRIIRALFVDYLTQNPTDIVKLNNFSSQCEVSIYRDQK